MADKHLRPAGNSLMVVEITRTLGWLGGDRSGGSRLVGVGGNPEPYYERSEDWSARPRHGGRVSVALRAERKKVPMTLDGNGVEGGLAATMPGRQDAADQEHATQPETVRVEVLRVGMRLARDIYDPEGVLLLASGNRITSRFLQLLSQRNIGTVRLEVPPPTTTSTDPEGRVERQLSRALSRAVDRAAETVQRHRALSFDDLERAAQSGLARHGEWAGAVASVGSCLAQNRAVESEQVCEAAAGLAQLMTLDCDLLATIVGMQRGCDGEYLFDHAVDCAMISMTIATQMGLSMGDTVEVGVGALLQNVGMLKVSESIRMAPRKLTPAELAEVRRYPIHTLGLLDKLHGIPQVARFIGYQVHEREDGSGYPRGRSGSTIHPYAKIVAVADAYTAMTRARPYRRAWAPHRAVRQLLLDGRAGKLDRAVLRAFLDCMAAFPVGSYVTLKKDIKARVVRANPGAHTRPVVAVVDEGGESTGWTIDLLHDERLDVLAAGASPTVLTSPGGRC